MTVKIPPEDFLDKAKSIPIGQERRAVHKRCSKGSAKPSLIIRNEPGCYSAKCYRCNGVGYVPKTHTAYTPAVRKQINPPTDVAPLVSLIAKHPHTLQAVLEREQLLPHLSLLTGSEQFGRVYFPDDSGSFCGLDFTGTAYAWWHSPYGHTLAYMRRDSDVLYIYNEAHEYLEGVRMEQCSCLFLPAVSNDTLAAVTALVLAGQYKTILCWHPSHSRIRKELSVTGADFKAF